MVDFLLFMEQVSKLFVVLFAPDFEVALQQFRLARRKTITLLSIILLLIFHSSAC